MIRRRCPVCTSTLAEMKTGAVTALGCRECRGMWFDLKALEEAAGEQVQLGPLEGASTLACSQCSAPLNPALFPGGIPVEACSTCNGFFLRSGDLGQPVSAISAHTSEQVAYRERLGSIRTTQSIAELIFHALQLLR